MKQIQLPKFKLTADLIMYCIALANAVRLAWAYAYADAAGNLLSAPGLAGALLGVALSVGTAFVAGKIPGLKAKSRQRLTWGALVAILLLEPVILAPLTVTDMPASLRATLPGGFGWGWAIVVALLPSLVIAAISFANGAMVEATAERPESEKASEQQPAAKLESEKKSAKKPQSEPVSEIPCTHAGAGCERKFASQNAANAHAKSCQFKPTTVYAEAK